MNVGNRLSETIFLCVATLFWKKKIKDIDFVSDGHCWDGPLNFEFAIVSTKSNYGGIFSFPDRLKFGQIWTTVNTLTVGNH